MRAENTGPSRNQVVAVLVVNAALWAVAVLLTGYHGLAAIGAIAVISISTLAWKRLPIRASE